MRRRDVSPEELAKIISLRQSNASWLKIQRDTGIPRRIAKRAYEQWGRSQSREELKAARKDVAAEEFRNHLHSLIKLAELLVGTLDIPQPSPHPASANEVLCSLLERDIAGEYEAYGQPDVRTGLRTYRTETLLRQNRMLFDSLKAHTHEKLEWGETLDKWRKARDTCTTAQGKLREEITKTLLSILNQRPKLTDRIVNECSTKDPVERMVDGILHAAWERISAGNPDQPPLIKAISRGNGMTDVVFGERRIGLGLVFTTETNLGKEVEKACTWAVKNVLITRKEDIVGLVNQVSTMKKVIDELTKKLNPLTLRPLILNTRCDLCPA
jgi:hypothetical protein